MIADNWEIGHIAIAVENIEFAMASYSAALGVEWGTPIELAETLVRSDVYPDGVQMAGVREVMSCNGGNVLTNALQLVQAGPSPSSAAIWGCPDGRHYVHHIAYWVDDFEAECDHLRSHGYVAETYFLDPTSVIDFVAPGGGPRFEIHDRDVKARLTKSWLPSGTTVSAST